MSSIVCPLPSILCLLHGVAICLSVYLSIYLSIVFIGLSVHLYVPCVSLSFMSTSARVYVCLSLISDETIPLVLSSLSAFHLLGSLSRDVSTVALWSSCVQCGAEATVLRVLEETATIQYAQTHDFVFAAQSGVRYDVDVRVADGGQEPCSSDLYGESTVVVAGLACHPDMIFTAQPTQLNGKPHFRSDSGLHYLYWYQWCYGGGCWRIDDDEDDSGYEAYIQSVADMPPTGVVQGREYCKGWGDVAITVIQPLQTAGDCSSLVSSRTLSCGTDLAEGGQYAHYCDRTCGFQCTYDGVTTTTLYVLPPGATNTSQAVATLGLVSDDKGLSFTAAATGDFTARVEFNKGSGPVTLTATAVGTAEHRSPPLRADGRPHPLEVSCLLNNCAFGYDGASAYDGDGSGFDLVRDFLDSQL
jgi:hypothetical protein